MELQELKAIVANAGDAAFAVDPVGTVIAWNATAEELFGLSAEEAIGRSCCDLLRGTDETGLVCGPQCGVQEAVRRRQPVPNYDIEVQTSRGKRWCNASILLVDVARATRPYSIHIWRSVDISKRFDMLLRDVVTQATGLPAQAVRKAISETRSPVQAANLSKRELEVLRMLAEGKSTREIAGALGIRSTTVSNHVGHILDKLNAHSRLEAVRRAEQAALI